MKHVKLFENFDGISENWETEITDIIKSDFRDLERDADNISKQDIDEVIQAYGRKHGEPDANYIDMFNFVGNYFGMEMQELQDMIEMAETKKTAKELFDMFTQINKDAKANGESEVALTDVEYYTDQINNIFFNNVNGKDNFPEAERMAKSMAEYAKSKTNEMSENYREELFAALPMADDPDIRQKAHELATEFEWDPDAMRALAYNMLVEVNDRYFAKEFLELAKKQK